MPVNWSEEFVCGLCDRSFLEPWAFMNPMDAGGKELSDALVVFENHVIVISVKEYTQREATKSETTRERWERKALRSSIRQLLGARRRIQRIARATEPASGRTVELPPLDRCSVHLVAICLGGLLHGRFGSRKVDGYFVHVLDEAAVVPHFAELDTVTEFLAYLDYRERSAHKPTSECVEEDWLGSYLLKRESLLPGSAPPSPGCLVQYLSNPTIKRMQEADPPSYFWDRTLLYLWTQRRRFMAAGAEIGSAKVPPPTAEAMDRILREMALHPRAERRLLGSLLLDYFVNPASVPARVFRGPTGPGYVVLRYDRFRDPDAAQRELIARCLYVLEFVMPDRSVIGLATTPAIASFNPDVRVVLCYLNGTTNSEWARAEIADIAQKAGFFQELLVHDVDHNALGIKVVSALATASAPEGDERS